MSYRPDLERALNEAIETVMPQTPEDWGLVALVVIGIWFAWMVLAIVLDAAKESFTRRAHEASPSDLRAPLER